MRVIVLSLTLIGIFTLILIYLFSTPLEIKNQRQLNKLLDNQKIKISGKVISEKNYQNYKLIILDKKLSLECKNPCKSYLNKSIETVAVIDKYNNRTYIKIKSIKTK